MSTPYDTTDPTAREEFITGLRELADWLAANPDLPVPRVPSMQVCVRGTDEEMRADITHYADLISAIPTWEFHYVAARSFGPIELKYVAIPSAARAEHDARDSYAGNIQTAA